ncbi:MAG TPA: N-acetylmuramoyl-L-alanine amidase [Kofleriaceae bacterium]|nr:N-acetylmuramoyl-L-alanine amidase [Kofleriaceae bacterium]
MNGGKTPCKAPTRQPEKRSVVDYLNQGARKFGTCFQVRRTKSWAPRSRHEKIFSVRFCPSLLVLVGLAASAATSGAAPSRPPVVVLDPGHGGSNPGAQGVAGLREKQLTLTLANLVATRLREHGIAVTLTRDTDKTLTLRQRVEVADRLPADIFVSIHANASTTRAQSGYETYVLTAKGVDIDARALRSGTTTPRPGVDPDIALVLDDLERGASQWESAELAARMQRSLRDRRGPDGDRGVRQDSHHVLLGATMPAVLVEVGFIDHPIEGKQLADPQIQAGIAAAIAEAIEDQLAD